MKFLRSLYNIIKFLFYFGYSYILFFGIFLIVYTFILYPQFFPSKTTHIDYIVDYYSFYVFQSTVIFFALLFIFYQRKLLFRYKKPDIKFKHIFQIEKTNLFRKSEYFRNRDRIRKKYLRVLKIVVIIQNIFALSLAVILILNMRLIVDSMGFVKYMDEKYDSDINLPVAFNEDEKFYDDWYDIFISIDIDGNLKINNVPISMSEFDGKMSILKNKFSDSRWAYDKFKTSGKEIYISTRTKFFIYADKNINMKILNRFFNILRKNNFRNCVLMTN